jgi:hypothetical protein
MAVEIEVERGAIARGADQPGSMPITSAPFS